MGWTSLHRDKGITTADFFAGELLHPYQSFIATSTKDGAFYAAVKDERDGTVFGLVCLITWSSRAYYNFSYKSMHECVGSYSVDAPAKVLDALTPTDHQYANEWRARCRENLAAIAARPKVRAGDTVRFEVPFDFQDGASEDTFVFVANTRFRAAAGWTCHLPSWRKRSHRIVSA